MADIKFDVDGARQHGYSDAEIADAIAKQANFDTTSARKAGYSDAEIISHLSAPSAPSPASAAQDKVASDTGVGQSMLIGAGHTADRMVKGVQQMYYSATGDDKAAADLKKQADSDEAAYKHLQDAHPIATAIGESAPAMAIPVGGAATTALGAAGKLAVQAAIPSALEYGSVGDRATRAAQSAVGATVGGVVIPKAAQAVVAGGKAALKGMAGNITPEALALAQRAKDLGIPVNVAQLGDSKFLKTLASSLEQMPFTGGASAAAGQRTAFTNAVSKTFGADVNKVTPEVYNTQKKRLGAQFDELAARNNLNVTPDVQGKLAGIVGDAEATGSDDTIRAMRNIMGRVTDQADVKGGDIPAQVSKVLDAEGKPIIKVPASSTPAQVTIPGETYSSIDTELSNIIKGGGEKGLYAKRMQSAIRDAMDNSISDADKAAWTETRAQYKNLKAVRNIVGKDMGNGDIPATQLMHSLNGTEAGKETMAMGTRGDLGDLGQVGKQFVRDQVPNSGTAQRLIAMGIIGGGGTLAGADPKTIAGMMVGGATAGRLINKVIWSPKTIEALTSRGLTIGDLAKMPPDKVTQILGGITGMTAAKQFGGN